MTRKALAGILLLVISGSVAATLHNSDPAPPDCKVQGVWQLRRVVTNGKVDSTSAQQRKIMTKNHFMWVAQESRRDTLPLKTARDSARVLNDAGGYGTYTVSGSNLTEKIELFPDHRWIGRDWKALCRTERGQWIHTWYSDPYNDSTGRSRRDTVVEYYTRLE